MKNERWDNTSDLTEIITILGKFYEQLFANKLDNQDEMHELLGRHKLSILTQELTEILKRSVTSKEIEIVTKNFPQRKARTRCLHQ